MRWSAGSRLGPYEIQSLLGAGGMGEVYKAIDTRLERLVAIKILSDDLAHDREFRERFQREARVISQLDHPHICPLYDVGEQSGTSFLVMQYLEGESLRERLSKGRLTLEDALTCAVQVADALDQAHRAGIVHRDLKPDNIFLTAAGAKLLDFGLAKRTGASPTGGGLSRLTTKPPTITSRGTILGTLPYMAPEQLEGREADSRTDIFALGVVVYEMLTGRRPFEGAGEVRLIAAIMQSEPTPVSSVRPAVPLYLDRIVSRCLAKDPDERWQTASDVMRELQWIAREQTAPGRGGHVSQAAGSTGRWRAWTFIAAALALALATALVYVLATRASPSQSSRLGASPLRIFVSPPQDSHLSGVQMAFSPDGTRVAYIGLTGQQRQVWVYSLATGESRLLAGSEDARFPFWSGDSRSICYVSDRGLLRMAADGGPSQVLSRDANVLSSGAWNDAGVVLYAGLRQPGIFRIASAGGSATRLTTPNTARGETEHVHPRFLPDGKQFLYLARNRRPEAAAVYIRSLDADDSKLILRTPTHAEFAAPDYLLFARDGVLLARHFNLQRREFEGDAMPVAQAVGVNTDNGGAAFSLSRNGALLYHAAVAELGELKLVDRQGQVRASVGPRELFRGIDLSPDGRKALVKIRGTEVTFMGDLWTVDLARGVTSRLTFGAEAETARWSADGKFVFFDSRRSGGEGIYRKRADGIGTEELVWKTNGLLADVAKDGRLLLEEGNACSIVALGPQPKTSTFVTSSLTLRCGRLSPDNRYLAYAQNEPGRPQVYLLPFPEGAGRIQVSDESGGVAPRWRRDGRELFYLSPGGAMMSVAVTYSPDLRVSPPIELFRTGSLTSGPFPDYTITQDGKQFLMIDPIADKRTETLTIVVNWEGVLKH